MKSRIPVIWSAISVVAVAATVAAVFDSASWPSTKRADAAPPPAAGLDPIGTFLPTVPNSAPPPSKQPENMVWIPGGEFSMGAQDAPDQGEVGMQATRDSRPIHRVYVDGFWMDKTDVTNEEFARFGRATGYVTVAERKPTKEEYPNAPP